MQAENGFGKRRIRWQAEPWPWAKLCTKLLLYTRIVIKSNHMAMHNKGTIFCNNRRQWQLLVLLEKYVLFIVQYYLIYL